MEPAPGEHTYVRLISQEGHVFVVERRAACVSKLIETMLSSDGFEEARHGAITFQEIKTAVLEKVCQYFYHKLRCDEAVKRGAEALPEFPIAPDIVLPLLMASNYLYC